MSSKPLALLPDRWIQKIWTTMRNTYGAAFDRQWECPAGARPEEHVKGLMAHWAEELGRFGNAPDAIAYALDNLPEHAPNLVQFKAICNRAPEPAFKSLPAPEVNKEAAAKALAQAAQATRQDCDRMTPIRGLMLREITGDKRLTRFQKDFWRKALQSEIRAKYGIDTSQQFNLADLAQSINGIQVAA